MLLDLIDWFVYDLLALPPESRMANAVHFFFRDSIKIFGLLAIMIFIIGVVRTWLPESKIKRWMTSKGIMGNIIAALFGALTPFCSCSSIPIFIGLLKVGAPLGVVFSFLITSPLINEYLAILMISEFGLSITIAYIASGLFIGIACGLIIGKLKLESFLEADVIESGNPADDTLPEYSLQQRLRIGFQESVKIIQQIWIWVLVGVGLGSFIHNYVPQETITQIISSTGPFSVPLATLLGVPMYGSCAAIVPVAVVLFEKGIPLGTALAFMMAMSALSLPEAVMLRRVMRLPLILIFFGVTTVAIIGIGILMNFLF